MDPLPDAAEVVNYWRQAGARRWFARNQAFDADFKARFELAHHAAASGALDHWAADAEGALALLILLDQLPRNAWRGSGHAFATDGRAVMIARAAVDAGLDRKADAALRAFFYTPFMHAESMAEQERSVELNAALDADTRRHALLHRDIIARFGRFPHRNRALGRITTPEEQQFLDGGGFSG